MRSAVRGCVGSRRTSSTITPRCVFSSAAVIALAHPSPPRRDALDLDRRAHVSELVVALLHQVGRRQRLQLAQPTLQLPLDELDRAFVVAMGAAERLGHDLIHEP